MNLWHDKSYIAPSGPEWVERGYAIYDVHSCLLYTSHIQAQILDVFLLMVKL